MPNPENIKKYEFKKGQSGNPKGRPKGRRDVRTVLRELLESQSDTGEYANPLAEQLIKIAFKGEKDADRLKAVNTIIDKIEGGEQEQPQQQVDISKLSLKDQKAFLKLLGKIEDED